MRHFWFPALCRRRLSGIVLAGGLALTCMGCHQHYYYYGDQCAPGAPVSSSVRTGPVCDVPAEAIEGGTKVADGSNRSTVVTGATSSSTSSKVVVSEPRDEPAKVAWRRSDPDGGVTSTSVQGTVNDATINR
jgi:hypothetical protein